MSTHRFIVEVEVYRENGPEFLPEGMQGPDRTPAMYAEAALNTAGLRDAEVLDGFADLPWTADLYVVGEA